MKLKRGDLDIRIRRVKLKSQIEALKKFLRENIEDRHEGVKTTLRQKIAELQALENHSMVCVIVRDVEALEAENHPHSPTTTLIAS